MFVTRPESDSSWQDPWTGSCRYLPSRWSKSSWWWLLLTSSHLTLVMYLPAASWQVLFPCPVNGLVAEGGDKINAYVRKCDSR